MATAKARRNNHAAGVSFDGLVDELADFGKTFDVFVALLDLAGGESQDGAVEIDVVASTELRIETGAEFQKGGDAPVYRDVSGGGMEDAGHHLQQGALAGAVFTHNTKGFALFHMKRDIV